MLQQLTKQIQTKRTQSIPTKQKIKSNMKTKAQGLSLNVIVIAGIVLIVLLVLWAIFTGQMSGFSSELGNCRNPCVDECTSPTGVIVKGTCPSNEQLSENTLEWSPGGKVCCVKLG